MTDMFSPLWNLDFTNVPKSYFKPGTKELRGKTVEVQVLVSVYFIAAFIGTSGPTTARVRWLPDEERFEGFNKGKTPIAWLPWPEFPEELLNG